MMDDGLFDYVRSSVDQPPQRRLSDIYVLIIRPDGLRDFAHRALRSRFHEQHGIPTVESLADVGVMLEGEYADCLQDFIDAVSQELIKPDMGKYRSYEAGRVLKSGSRQTLDNYIASRAYEWHYNTWIAKWRREQATDFSASETPEEREHDLAAAAVSQLQRRADSNAPAHESDTELASLLSLRLWQLNRHAPTDTVPAAYGALQLWPQIDWAMTPAATLAAFCQDKWSTALVGIAEEHAAAETAWAELNARLDTQVQERWSGATERKESITRRGRYLVKAIFCPLTNARANARLGLEADNYKTRQRYYDLLDAWTKQGGEDREIDGFLALPLPKRRWIPRKGGRDFDPERDTVDAWLRLDVGAPPSRTSQGDD